MIDLKHLRTLLALRKTGNLTKAADMLHLTQSALSQQIRLLESDYGLLFERKTVPLAFTIVGQRLLELADRIFRSLKKPNAISSASKTERQVRSETSSNAIPVSTG